MYVEPGTPEEGRRAAHLAFEDAYGTAPTLVGRAPGRVNLIGEHTDYNGGLCLPLTLPHATWAAVAERTDRTVRIRSDADVTPWEGDLESVRHATGWAAYVAGVIWALGHPRGVDVMVHSTVPIGSGLSSSAALECSMAVALSGLAGRELTDAHRRELVSACVRAETEVAGAPTGGLDQNAALLAPRDGALLIDFSTDHTDEVPFPVTDADLSLLVIDTGVHHTLATSEYGVRRAETAKGAELLGVAHLGQAGRHDWQRIEHPTVRHRVRHQITENERVRAAVVAIRARDWARLGELFVASHTSLRDDYAVSAVELDVTVETALAAGALGARMTGGGFGGSAIALAPTDALEHIANAVNSAFRSRGWGTPTFLRAGEPSDRAGVVEDSAVQVSRGTRFGTSTPPP